MLSTQHSEDDLERHYPHFDAELAVAILRGDTDEVEEMGGQLRKDSEAQNRAILDLPAPEDPVNLEDYNEIDPIDPDAQLGVPSIADVIKMGPTLRRLMYSWIAAGYSIVNCGEWPSFERFISRRKWHFYQDHSGRLVRQDSFARRRSPSYDARLLFLRLLEGPDCQNIGRCESCAKFCLRQKKSRKFFCNIEHYRRLRSRLVKESLKQARLEALKKAMTKLKEPTPWPPGRAWREKLLVQANKIYKGGGQKRDPVKLAFLTRVINSGKLSLEDSGDHEGRGSSS
jgi:hypothetical protein